MKRLATITFAALLLTVSLSADDKKQPPGDGNPCPCLTFIDGRPACFTCCHFCGYERDPKKIGDKINQLAKDQPLTGWLEKPWAYNGATLCGKTLSH